VPGLVQQEAVSPLLSNRVIN